MIQSQNNNSFSRRQFVKGVGGLAAAVITEGLPVDAMAGNASAPALKTIRIEKTDSNFEREPLIRPFGFKGGYMTEMWQTVVQLTSASAMSKIGLCTQNVLYSDPDVFAAHSEAAGNALMYALTDKALQKLKNTSFSTPVELLDKLLPEVLNEGKKLTGSTNLNPIFPLNALIGVDNAAWLLFAAENKFKDFDAMIPVAYKPALSYHNRKVAIMYLASYNLPVTDLIKAVEQGYFVIKIKIGQPGTQDEMVEKDKARLTELHQALRNARTKQTANGKLVYTLDANGRYEKKESVQRLLDHAKKIGALEQILFIEEPLNEKNEEQVSDLGVRIGADESAHNEETVLRRLQQGYGLVVLKGIAKTLSLSMKIAQLAHERGVPCMCADLTVNPILIDWNKNLAARLKPFPGLNMGLLETNGDLNYRNWQTMMGYHPAGRAPWTLVKDGVFNLDEDFYTGSGGVFQPSEHYTRFFKVG